MPRPILAVLALAVLAILSCRERPKPPQEFVGTSSFSYIQSQVALGPRVPGTPAHEKMGDWLDSLLRQRADTVVVQSWTHVTAAKTKLPLRNFIARFNPSADKRLLLLAHWDSRPVSDSPTSRDSSHAVQGANDGGSGVA